MAERRGGGCRRIDYEREAPGSPRVQGERGGRVAGAIVRMEASSRKRAAEGEGDGAPSAQKQAAAGGEPSVQGGEQAVVFPSGDFSSWALDQASGWYRSPDGAWSYNSATFIFFHAATAGYYMYDATQQSYVSVRCEYGEDGQLHVVQEPAQPVPESPPPEFSISVEAATMQGRRQKQEDRFTIVADLRATLSESGCAAAPPLPASFCGVYDGHAGHDTSEFVAEQLHKDIATSLAARQNAADSGDAWSDDLIVAAIKDGYAKTDETFLNWARAFLPAASDCLSVSVYRTHARARAHTDTNTHSTLRPDDLFSRPHRHGPLRFLLQGRDGGKTDPQPSPRWSSARSSTSPGSVTRVLCS